MVTFETMNELTLRVTCRGNDVIYTKAGAFIAGDSITRNYQFEKVLLGPEGNFGQALLGSLVRRATGENIPLMKVTMNGDSVTYYANQGQHVVVYQLAQGEMISVESENLLAFSSDCRYNVRFIGVGVFSQKGLATTTLTGNGPNAFVAIITNGNPLALSNANTGNTITVDPDAVICWMGYGDCDPAIKADMNWKTLIGQSSGESYMFEWNRNNPVTVIVQPSERGGNYTGRANIRVGMD
ncbi:MAG TPA: AIM24 family protein [Ruminococcus sp.]|nr:AIM24 family protein [Ruminococcus sp.]